MEGGRKYIGRCSHAMRTCEVKQGDKIMRMLPLQRQPPLRAASAAGAACAPPRGRGNHRRFARGWRTYSNTHKLRFGGDERKNLLAKLMNSNN
eukprot:1336173-Pleurochrysis_carterae.AAC.1